MNYRDLDAEPEFSGRNTTTEFLARTIFERMSQAIRDGRLGPSAAAGIGTLPEEPAIRAIITNTITNDPSSALLTDPGRAKLKSEILSQIKSTTDVKVTDILFTDLAVQ